MIWRQHIHNVVLRLPDSWLNWNLEVQDFEEKGKPEYLEKNFSGQRREPTTNSTHLWRPRQDLNPGHICGRRALSPLRHPLLPQQMIVRQFKCLLFGLRMNSVFKYLVEYFFFPLHVCLFSSLRVCSAKFRGMVIVFR